MAGHAKTLMNAMMDRAGAVIYVAMLLGHTTACVLLGYVWEEIRLRVEMLMSAKRTTEDAVTLVQTALAHLAVHVHKVKLCLRTKGLVWMLMSV